MVRILVDLSTTGPRVSGEVAAALMKANIVLVDAPVSGGRGGAIKGTLAVMAAAPRDAFDAVAEYLAVFGKVIHVGEKAGLAQTMKLVNNLMSVAALAITSEGMVMGVKAGLDPQVMLDVLNASSGRNSATVDKFPRAVIPRTFDFGFTTGLSMKDIRLCLQEADAMGVPHAGRLRRAADSLRHQFGLWAAVRLHLDLPADRIRGPASRSSRTRLHARRGGPACRGHKP